MVFISPKLTALMLAVVPPLSLAAVFYGRYLRTLSKQTQDALGDMTKVAEEKLSAFRTLTAFNSQPTEAKAVSGKVDRVFQLARKEAIASGIFFGGTGLTGNLTMLCLLGYGGHLVSVGEISVGSLTSLLIYTGYDFIPFAWIFSVGERTLTWLSPFHSTDMSEAPLAVLPASSPVVSAISSSSSFQRFSSSSPPLNSRLFLLLAHLVLTFLDSSAHLFYSDERRRRRIPCFRTP
jgi:ABC-type multidrug transport system fused ATPase/permease subunit